MTTPKQRQQISKFLSFVLRHKPEAIDLTLDPNGWADIDELITKANQSGQTGTLDRMAIEDVVATNDKKRFMLSEDGLRIRASQGHSIKVDLQLEPALPPELLYHGTASRFVESIMQEGLKPQQRHHVHLSQETATAHDVGQRYGKPVILTIQAGLMHQQGCRFYRSDNGVWLTDQVLPEFIQPAPQNS